MTKSTKHQLTNLTEEQIEALEYLVEFKKGEELQHKIHLYDQNEKNILIGTTPETPTSTIIKQTITQVISSPSSSIIPYRPSPNKKETPTELEARSIKILSSDPLQFLLDDLHKRVPGNQLISRMLILGFMSLHPRIDILLHQLITGASGRGKSYEIHQCAELLHPIHKVPVEHVTPKSLNYYCEDDGTGSTMEDGTPVPGLIGNKLLYLDDITESDLPILKTLGNNDGTEPSGISIVNQKTYKWIWDGYPLTICSKVSLPENDEDGQIRSRYLIYGVEESPEHLKEITDKMAIKKSCLSSTTDISSDPACIQIIRLCIENTAINEIKSREPIQYPPSIEPRNLNFYLSMCQAHTLLNHKNRKIHNGILIIEQADIDYVNTLWHEISIHNTEALTTLELRILSILKPITAPRTRDQTIPGMKELGFGSQPTISAALDKLESLQMIAHIGNRPKAYYLL